mmetsp:Transcript_8503/g.28955  ORF Transcript_8503/g.28955 Transcript_8503/m.28955 type:complete len:795 (+) Transcript_8503:410-2794(+)
MHAAQLGSLLLLGRWSTVRILFPLGRLLSALGVLLALLAGVGVELRVLPLDGFDERVHSPLELDGGARFDEPVEAEEPTPAHLLAQLVPLPVPELVGHAHQEAVLLLIVKLALERAVVDAEREPRVLGARHLGGEGVRDLLATLDARLPRLDALDDLVVVVDLRVALEEDARVRLDLRLGLALNVGGHVGEVLSPVGLAASHKGVEVLARPVAEALLEELRLLGLLLGRETVGLLLVLRGGARGLALVLALPRVKLLLAELLEAHHVVKLKVLELLLGQLGPPGPVGLVHLPRELAVHVVVGLAVSLGQADELEGRRAARIRGHLGEVLALVVVQRLLLVPGGEAEVGQGVDRGRELLVLLLRLLLTVGEEGVEVLLAHRARAVEDGVRAKADHALELLLARRLILLNEAPLLDDHRVEVELALRALNDLLLDGALGDEAVAHDAALLADAVCAVLRLKVHLGVPVRVVEDHRVRRGQVDAEPPGAGGEEEDELGGARRVEGLHGLVTRVAARAPVDAAVLVLAPKAVVLEDVQHAGHLGEDEHAVAALGAEPHHDAVEEHHLARGLHDGLVDAILTRGVLGPVEEEGVVAHLAQLHEHVVEPHRATVRRGELLLQHAHIHALLLLRELRVEHVLELVGDAEVHVRLEPAEEEGPEDEVELGDHLLLLLALEDLLLAVPVLDGKVKPVLEGVEVVEDVREQKVEEGPELREVVLQGGAREEEAVARIHRLEVADEPAVEVLEAVALVHHEELPVIAPELLHVPEDDLVGGNYHGEGGLVGEPHVLRAEPRALLL